MPPFKFCLAISAIRGEAQTHRCIYLLYALLLLGSKSGPVITAPLAGLSAVTGGREQKASPESAAAAAATKKVPSGAGTVTAKKRHCLRQRRDQKQVQLHPGEYLWASPASPVNAKIHKP